jgi:MFS transporter, OFA family, oxalate/formate antiporter
MVKTINRWIIVLGALIIQLCLGAIYAWSVFVNPLKEQYFYTTTQTQIIFSVGLATFAITMIFAGKLQDKIGPKKVAIMGGILLGTGYILASFTNGSFIKMIITIGLIAGSGIGLGYVCPIASLIKWFPDKRGLITGLAVAGFGAGAWIFAQLASSFIINYGIMNTFLILGIIFFIAVILGSLVLCNPPKGWSPKGWNVENKKTNTKSSNYEWNVMIKTPQFWMLWLMFTFASIAGLMVIGNINPFGIHSGLTPAIAASTVGILAIFNGSGRIGWGWISDKIGRSKSMFVMFLLQAIMMFILIRMGTTALLIGIAAAWIGFNYGGVFSLFPSASADFFGTKNIGLNYGLLFTSYGVAGIIGPILGGRVFDITGSYLYAFIPAGILCLIAAIISFMIKSPKE